MIERKEIQEVVRAYDKPTIGVLGSHSALEIAHGAKKEGFETVVLCEKGREKVYTQHYNNLFDHYLVLDEFKEVVERKHQKKLKRLNTIWVPHRSFSCYVGYDNIEDKFRVPMIGNRFILRAEERNTPKNQFYLLDQAGIARPQKIQDPKNIEGPVIVKVHEKGRQVERAFFYASSYEEYKKKSNRKIEKGIISKGALKEASIEEVVLGGLFNANFFWSPLKDEIDLLGFDRRIQTNLDGMLRLPAQEQLEIGISPQNVEIGHMGATMRESQIEKIFEAGRKFVETCKEEYPPGIIGLFALQGVMTKDLVFKVFDVSPRSPGCPCVKPTSPYMRYKYDEEIGPGRRTAMEIKKAWREGKLKRIVT